MHKTPISKLTIDSLLCEYGPDAVHEAVEYNGLLSLIWFQNGYGLIIRGGPGLKSDPQQPIRLFNSVEISTMYSRLGNVEALGFSRRNDFVEFDDLHFMIKKFAEAKPMGWFEYVYKSLRLKCRATLQMRKQRKQIKKFAQEKVEKVASQPKPDEGFKPVVLPGGKK